MKTLRIGIIGLGNMGTTHARAILDGKVPGAGLAAVCDPNEARFAAFPDVPGYLDSGELITSGKVDAVVIATPHFSHTTIGIEALRAGLHVLVEKPISVHKADCEKLIAAHKSKKQVFAAMFNQRTDPYYLRLRKLIQSGELGPIRRLNWIITDWFRTHAYYASGGWRATWAGEGGGVLLNQCPHQLDLWQWMFGLPQRVRAFCKVGRYHDIEVEDDVTAYLDYDSGVSGIFIASTGEAPGTNRLEVTAENGRVVIENDRFLFTRNEEPMSEFSRTSASGFAAPPKWNVEIPMDGHGGQHLDVLRNFVAAVREGTPLIAPAREGIHSVELANAILLSSFQGKTIDLPLNATTYSRWLKKKISTSTFVKKTNRAAAPAGDFAKSWAS